MRVFVTGASGHIGSALVPELVAAGHEVIGLARSDASASAVEAFGGQALRGDLTDPDGLAAAAADADGVIHLAFNHEAMATGDYGTAMAMDLAAIGAFADALAGSGKPFVGTAGTLLLAMLGLNRTGTEEDTGEGGRGDAENLVVGMAERGVRSSVVRLPPTVHSDLDLHGFVPILIAGARTAGVSGYPGDGANRWPAVHTRDAAHLYRLALEHAPAGSRLHAVGDEGVPFREIAETIGRNLGVPTDAVPAEAVQERFGMLAGLVGMDNPTSAKRTEQLLGWAPVHPGLIADMDQGHYFTTA